MRACTLYGPYLTAVDLILNLIYSSWRLCCNRPLSYTWSVREIHITPYSMKSENISNVVKFDSEHNAPFFDDIQRPMNGVTGHVLNAA